MFFILIFTFFTTLKREKSKHFGDLVKLPKPENPGAENAFHSITEKPARNPENAGGMLDFWFTNFTSGKGNSYLAPER